MASLKRMISTASGTSFCEAYAEKKKHSWKAGQSPAELSLPLRREEVLHMIDLLFERAGLRDDSTEDEVVKQLGEDGLRTVLRLYTRASQPDMFAAVASDSDSGERETDISDSASENSALCAVPDVDYTADEQLQPITKRRRIAAVSVVPEVSSPVTPTTRGKYKKETEIAVSRILELGKVVSVEHPEIEPDAPHFGAPVLTMTGFGELGRWGNQILQYMFMVCSAKKAGATIQVPYWVGNDIFALDNTPVKRRFPAAIEDRTKKANSTFTDDFMEYIRASNRGREVPEVFADVLDPTTPTSLQNVDLWGWFQWPTDMYRPYKQLIMNTFTPVQPLRTHFDNVILEKLRNGSNETTLVGLHLRLGDYKNISASSFGYCAPTSWYLEWLEKIWPTLKNPVLFVASDEIETVLRDFAAYNPITSDMLKANMPDGFKELDAGFFPDWYILSQCDVAAISNSSFSFTACMLNQRSGARFFRAHYEHRMVEFDPWNADPIVHREMSSNVLAELGNTIRVLYNTQGTRGVVKNVLYELPFYGIRAVVMKAVLKARALA